MTSEAVEAADEGAAEDRALLERLRAGEDAAFGELFSRHSAAVFRLALGLANDRSEADDLTAEAFFRVLQAIRRGSGPVDNVRGYLLIVARRVAWEWSLRRKDVPVSDEELTHRAPSNPDTSGQFTERNLIRRAFTSLPERWRKVLWKMEVEGERPAAVATNFGLSPNATAALARRARQGLRAAYLQAHLASERSATGCRSVLEKLGAYTAGTTSGIERRRIRAHLGTCSSCTAMYAELRDVCSGLRAHAGLMAAPVVAAAGWQLGAVIKGLFASTKIQAGARGDVRGRRRRPRVRRRAVERWRRRRRVAARPGRQARGRDERRAPAGPAADGDRGAARLAGLVDQRRRSTRRTTASSADGAEGSGSTSEVPTGTPAGGSGGTTADDGRDDAPMSTEAATFDESAPIVYRETTVERRTTEYETYTLVDETTTVTEVNSLDQTRTTTQTTSYTEPHPPEGSERDGRDRNRTNHLTGP